MKISKTLVILVAWSQCAFLLNAQQPAVTSPAGPPFWRSYRPSTVSHEVSTNSQRLRAMIRSGRLYLTLQDAIGLAIENNLDLEIERSGPLSLQWELERERAGGPLKGVTAGNAAVNQITAGQGVLGAQQAAGLLVNNAIGSTNAQSNGSVSQIGPIAPNLDPVLQNTSIWSHTTAPQPNQVISQTAVLIDEARKFTIFVQQGLLSGGFVQLAGNETYLRENSPSDILNPSFAPVGQLYVRQNLLDGFGVGLNSRYIRIAEKQVTAANLTFQLQLIDVVANVAHIYWSLVSAEDDVKAKQQAQEYAERFEKEARARIDAGALAGVNIYRAMADSSARQQDLKIARGNASQWELALKDVVSRNGVQDPLLDAAEIVPLDRMQIPGTDDSPSLRELLARALAKRPDIERDAISNDLERLSELGTRNGLLPQLQAIGTITNRAVAGSPNPISTLAPNSYLIGGSGTAWAQIFRNDYAGRSGALVLQAPLHNHLNQADFGIDQLQARQNDLVERQSRNQLVVDISNHANALKQARARYTNAVDSFILDQQLLEAEQQKLALGNSTLNDVVNIERALALAQSLEVAALAQYVQSRVSLDQVLGETLEVNHVLFREALKGSTDSASR